LWTARLPSDPDAFIAMRLQGHRVTARTWSGFSIQLDPNSGRTLQQEFVK